MGIRSLGLKRRRNLVMQGHVAGLIRSEDGAGQAAGAGDLARCLDHCRHIGNPRRDMVSAIHLRQQLDPVEAVLQADNLGFGADHGAHIRRRLIRGLSLHREQHRIADAKRCRIVGHSRKMHRLDTVFRGDGEAVF